MAIGDFLIQMSALNTAMAYVPAGSNVFMLLSSTNGNQGSTEQTQVTDGAGNCQLFQDVNAANTMVVSGYLNSKILINNTYYFNAAAGGANARSWFSAVQVE